MIGGIRSLNLSDSFDAQSFNDSGNPIYLTSPNRSPVSKTAGLNEIPDNR